MFNDRTTRKERLGDKDQASLGEILLAIVVALLGVMVLI
jgi:hypothetical protein